MEVVTTTTRRAFRGTSGKMASLHEAGLDSGNHSPRQLRASGNVSPPIASLKVLWSHGGNMGSPWGQSRRVSVGATWLASQCHYGRRQTVARRGDRVARDG